MGFKQHISRTWQMIEQQVNDVPFRPHNEAPRQVKFEKNQCLCGFREFPNRINLPLYTKFTPIGAKNGAETKKSHNFEFHTAPEKLHLLRSFFHFS